MSREARPAERATWLEDRRRNEIERFDRLFAPTYDHDWGGVLPTHARMLERFLSLCSPGAGILDAACGTGKYWPDIIGSGRRPEGIDQSSGMLAQAATKHPDVPTSLAPLTGIDAVEAFGGVICVDAMEYVPPEEWPIVLSAFHRALFSGGLLYLTIEQADRAELRREFEQLRQAGHPVVLGESIRGPDPREDDGYHFYPPDGSVDRWLRDAGFEVLVDETGDDYRHLIARRA